MASVSLQPVRVGTFLELDLSTRSVNKEIFRGRGDTITILRKPTADIRLQLDAPTGPVLNLRFIKKMDFRPASFRTLHISHEAIPGAFLTMFVGGEASVLVDPELVGSFGVLTRAGDQINPATEESVAALRQAGLVDPYYVLETITPLGAGASFVGEWIDLRFSGFAQIHALAFSDQNGTLFVDFGEDTMNARLSVSAPLTGGSAAGIVSRIFGRYVRVRYVNGPTAQTVFTLSRRFTVA